jgi:hypothetical protein
VSSGWLLPKFCWKSVCCPVRTPETTVKSKVVPVHVIEQYRSTHSGVPRREFRNFDKAEPNSKFRQDYIHNNLIRIRGSLICKLSGTPDYGAAAPRSPFSTEFVESPLLNSWLRHCPLILSSAHGKGECSRPNSYSGGYCEPNLLTL